MKILKDTIEPLVEVWDDPGDYPSNAGSGPLPSYSYLAGLEGELLIELLWEEYLCSIFNTDERATPKEIQEWLSEDIDWVLPDGVDSAKWEYEESGGVFRGPVTIKLWAEEAEGDGPYVPDRCEDDYF